MSDVLGPYIAEYVLAHLLHDAQQLAHFAAAQARHAWSPAPTRTLRGTIIGMAGLGQLGGEVARLARAFGIETWGLRRGDGAPAVAVDRLFTATGLDAFLGGLDALVITLPATAETRGFIGARELGLMKATATLINVGRGSVIDEPALIDALERGRLRRAILDTFREEPLPPASPLWSCPNLTVTPHVAGPSRPRDVAPICARNLAAFAAGTIPGPLLDRARGY